MYYVSICIHSVWAMHFLQINSIVDYLKVQLYFIIVKNGEFVLNEV